MSTNFEYRDFNQMYFNLIPRLLKNADKYLYQNMASAMIKDMPLVITCDKTTCDKIDITKVAYKRGKWTHLYRSYLNPYKHRELREIPLQGLTWGFDFHRKTQGNGACMREIILTRPDYKSKWREATVFYRTVDMAIKFPVDLIMLHHILENVIPNTDIKKITLVFGNAYIPLMYVPPFLHSVFGMSPATMKNLEKTNKNGIIKYINYCYRDYYTHASDEKRMLASGIKLLKYWQKIQDPNHVPDPPLTYKELTLDGLTTRPKNWFKS